jgi:hypothetical protein
MRKVWTLWHGRCGGEERRIEGFVGKLEGKIKLRRTTRRWEDDIKVDLKGTRCASVDRIILLTFRNYFVQQEH